MWSTRSRHTGAVMLCEYVFVCGWGEGINFESDEASLATVQLFPPASHQHATYMAVSCRFLALPSFFMNIQHVVWLGGVVECPAVLEVVFINGYIYIYIVNSRYFNRLVFKINESEAWWKTALSYGFEYPDVPDKFLLNHRTHTPTNGPPLSHHTADAFISFRRYIVYIIPMICHENNNIQYYIIYECTQYIPNTYVVTLNGI